jgi:hypothetical protein
LADKQKDHQNRIRQLKLLREYRGCSQCESKEADATELYDNNQLVCQPCLIKKAGRASGVISFLEQQKWYQKYWKIDLTEWLTKFQCLPVNANCAREWLKNKEHLNNCACLVKKAHELHQLFTNSLKRSQELLKDCQCKTNPKVRVSSDNYAWCEKCEATISATQKKRVIKNRHDPRFWGLECKEKVLCGNCLTNYQAKMPKRKQYLFNEYRKRYNF